MCTKNYSSEVDEISRLGTAADRILTPNLHTKSVIISHENFTYGGIVTAFS